jgi:hypothetical protein
MAGGYDLRSLENAVENPSLVVSELQNLWSSVYHRGYEYAFRRRYGEGIDVMAADWDNLVVLDACRWDYFRDQNPIEGEFERVVSQGAGSWPFMEGNFDGRELHDTVYVSSNPFARNLDGGTFHDVELPLDRWDEEFNTVRPGDVVDVALDYHERYPNKRLIVHFMQPHRPHLGPTAERLRERVELRGYNRDRGLDDPSYERTGIHLWQAVEDGRVSISEMRQSYRECLDIVLGHASDLVDALDGRSVVTADHGELLGDRLPPSPQRRYGHGKPQCSQLRVVPWLVVEADTRREITSEPPVETDRVDESVVEERLHALGYRD